MHSVCDQSRAGRCQMIAGPSYPVIAEKTEAAFALGATARSGKKLRMACQT